MTINDSQLSEWKREMDRELANLESQAKTINARITDTREKLEAVNLLLRKNGDEKGSAPQSGSPHPTEPLPPRIVSSNGSSKKEDFTPVYMYWPFILKSLIALSGSAPSERVVDRVGQDMEKFLTPADKEMLPSGVDIRWRNRVAWQRYNMIKQGLLRADSPRGIWEITEEGRRWLKDWLDKSKDGGGPRNDSSR